MDKKKLPGLAILIGKHSKSQKEPMDEDIDLDKEARVDGGQRLIDAIHSGDAEAVVDAILDIVNMG